MQVKILGTGCHKCQKLTEATLQAAAELGVKIVIEKITDLEKILSYSVMSTPALVVDDIVKVTGRVPSNNELKRMLS